MQQTESMNNDAQDQFKDFRAINSFPTASTVCGTNLETWTKII